MTTAANAPALADEPLIIAAKEAIRKKDRAAMLQLKKQLGDRLTAQEREDSSGVYWQLLELTREMPVARIQPGTGDVQVVGGKRGRGMQGPVLPLSQMGKKGRK